VKIGDMKMNRLINQATVCRWVARIVGTLLVIVSAQIAVGQGVPNPFTQPAAVQVGFLGLALLFGGILAGWKWELAGGMISLSGWCLLLPGIGHAPSGPAVFGIAVAVPGALYVASALLARYHEKQLSA
jgi:hypothetical protein